MIPFYQKIVALVVAGMAATLIAYRYWFGAEKKKTVEGGELRDIKEGLETKKKTEKDKEEKGKRGDRKTEKSEKSEKKKDTKEEEDVKTGKSIRDEPKNPERSSEDREEEGVKTCKSIKAAVSPPQIVAEKTGSCTSAVPVSQQKSALTLLNELKENSARVKVEATQSTSETNVSPKPSETPEKKTEDTNPMFSRIDSPPPLSITRDAPQSPAITPSTSEDLISKDTQKIPGSVTTTPVTTGASVTSTTPSLTVASTSEVTAAKELQTTPDASQTVPPAFSETPATPPPVPDTVTPSGVMAGSETPKQVEQLVAPKPAEPPVAQPSPIPESEATSGRSQPSLSAVNSEIELTESGTIQTKVMRIHQCFCRAVGRSKGLEDNQCVYDPKTKLNLQPTEIHPISYSIYEPMALTKPIKPKTSLSKEIQTKKKSATTDYLTPFGPVLNAVAYSHQHGLMVEDLVNNKDFFDF